MARHLLVVAGIVAVGLGAGAIEHAALHQPSDPYVVEQVEEEVAVNAVWIIDGVRLPPNRLLAVQHYSPLRARGKGPRSARKGRGLLSYETTRTRAGGPVPVAYPEARAHASGSTLSRRCSFVQ